MGRGKPRDRHPVGRAADVVHPDPMEEGHADRVSAVLAAHAHHQSGLGAPSALGAQLEVCYHAGDHNAGRRSLVALTRELTRVSDEEASLGHAPASMCSSAEGEVRLARESGA